MSQPGFEVRPELLERVAAEVAAVRDDHARAALRVESAGQALDRPLAGWRIARTTQDTAFAWRDDAKRVNGWLDGYATAARRCAQDYEYGDRVTAEAITLFPAVE